MPTMTVTVPDRVPMLATTMTGQQPSPVPESVAKDAIIAWFRGEFAAANAIIDALCNHLTQVSQLEGISDGSEYESVFAAIHRRRLNWIPILNMQKYFSIADVPIELKKVVSEKKMKKRNEEEEAEKKNQKLSDEEEEEFDEKKVTMKGNDDERESEIEERNEIVESESKDLLVEKLEQNNGDCENETVEEDSSRFDSSDRTFSDEGSQGGQLPLENIQICSNHEDCESRRYQIKMTKGFIAKEPVKGHMVNVVKGLKLYEDIFTDSELSKLSDYINELHNAGCNGELSGDTFILFNQQLKGNKRELIQLGVPIFGQMKDDKTNSDKCNIEPIPSVLQTVIDHLTQWHLLPETRRPNSCIINFFDEGEHSQPFLKPPHLDQPISTLLLSESTMAFGRILVSDNQGNYKGPLMLSLKEGSLLVMRGNSADMAKHVICPSSNKRVSITFFRVRSETNQVVHSSTVPPLSTTMTSWQPGMPQPLRVPNGSYPCYGPMEMVPKWGFNYNPLVMLAPTGPMIMNPRKLPKNGTGVFLPWTMKSKKPAKHLPPRAQRARLLALPSSRETQVMESSTSSAITV